MNEQEQKQYRYLVAGNVIIEVEGQVQAIPQNAMIVTDDQNIGVYQLGKAQQALQLTLFKKLGEQANVVDVIITNVVLLGHMTDAEFNFRPADLAVQERAKPTAEIIDLSQEMKDRT
jgi:hypothetical protein